MKAAPLVHLGSRPNALWLVELAVLSKSRVLTAAGSTPAIKTSSREWWTAQLLTIPCTGGAWFHRQIHAARPHTASHANVTAHLLTIRHKDLVEGAHDQHPGEVALQVVGCRLYHWPRADVRDHQAGCIQPEGPVGVGLPAHARVHHPD